LPVIYGDTDSLFVHVGDATSDEAKAERGRALAGELTALLAAEIARDYRVDSHLELRFESHYLRFLMPTTRGTQLGSKKRYAGTVRKADGSIHVIVRGLEVVRRDWSPLARRVQLELLRRVFADEPYEAWLIEVARDLVAGKLDDELVYRKRVRGEADTFDYVMTTRGPEALDARTAPIDTEHYLAKQLAPVCDVVLGFLGTSFERIAGLQTSLF
ncbi:MAG: polymerase, partial [Myxococcaceae bacterium]|nr:polymerase [Myxococcaceae bacterium]